MSTISSALSPDDLNQVPWPELEVHSRDDLARVRSVVATWLHTPDAFGGDRLLRVIQSLLNLHPDRRDIAECPFHRNSDFDRLMLPDLQVLLSFIQDQPPSLIRARAADVAWWHRRGCSHQQLDRAVADYTSLARIVLDVEHWLDAFDCLSRAASLGAALGRGSKTHRLALDTAFELLSSVQDDPKYFSLRTASLLLEHRHPAVGSIADKLDRIADKARVDGNLHRARDYLDVVQSLRLREGHEKAARSTRIKIASLLEQDAAEALGRGDALGAVGLQEKAVEAWRAVGSSKDEVTAARVELQRLQRLSVQRLAGNPRVTPVDLSDVTAEARERVSGKPWLEALRQLCLFRALNASLERHRNSAKKSIGEFLFYSLLPMRAISPSGRSVHVRPSGFDDPDAALDAAFRLDLSTMQQTLALGAIKPAAETIQLEHGITASWILGLVSRSPFVPPDRIVSFARGIALGFQGDFVVAAHILLPQFENAVRCHLELRGTVVSTLPASGIQNEMDLGGVLTLPEATDLLGENEIIELRSLLVEKAGTNLRNRIAHGLIPDGDGFAHMVYFWWKVLQYVVLPAMSDSESETEAHDTTEAG